MKNRKLNRLAGYNYSQSGMYFVTICVKNRECLFGEIVNGKMVLNDYGIIVKNVWDKLPHHYFNTKLDEYMIMPNHFHGIIEILPFNNVGTGFKPVPTDGKRHSLSEIVRGFKTFSSKYINQKYKMPGRNIWQRSFHDRVIRNEKELNKIREYIFKNPINWKHDRNNLM